MPFLPPKSANSRDLRFDEASTSIPGPFIPAKPHEGQGSAAPSTGAEKPAGCKASVRIQGMFPNTMRAFRSGSKAESRGKRLAPDSETRRRIRW